jgi:tRNA pseudouridine55 synthase
VVDKSAGMTSHDVVAAARRLLGITRIGHTGTLDPFATGVLPLACGRATRLVRFLSASDKTYEATICFGATTDSYDVTGRETGRSDARPDADAVMAAIESLVASPTQVPPAFSAKSVAGQRAYDLARRAQPVTLAPASVRVREVEVVSLTRDRLMVRLRCSAGFYVRSFAHDLGQRTECGAYLEALRRTRSGQFSLATAVGLDALRSGAAGAPLIALADLLPEFASVIVNSSGFKRFGHGQALRPEDIDRTLGARLPVDSPSAAPAGDWLRAVDADGRFLGLVKRAADGVALHPDIVLT